jgi:hypothetical protein
MSIQRISKQKKDAYNLVVKEYKDRVELTMKKAKKFERDGMLSKDKPAFYKRIAAASVYLSTVGLYCEMSQKSVEIMNIKNDLYLGNARKNIYQALKLLESIFGVDVDSSLTENAETLDDLKILNPRRVLHLLKKIDYDIALVEYNEGENSRFKWTFVELYGRFAAISKNIVNFKQYANLMNNPMAPFYAEINDLLTLVKQASDTAAQKYRTKYELSTMDISDMQRAIDFMQLLVRIHVILNEQTFAQNAKKTIEKWKEKLEQDLKKKEEEAKKKNLAPPKKR